jgi:diguanylate cyclase (GGDEF)-like protein/PAS domain S-box-containing protein
MFNLDQLTLKDIFNFTSDGIFIMDQEWRIVAMNYAAETLTGWEKSEVESMRLCTELFLCFDRDGNQLCETACPKQAVRLANSHLDPLEIKVMKKSGQAVILPGLCVLIPSQKGEPPYSAILIKDEVEKQLLEERLLAGERLDPLTHLYHRQYFDELYTIEAKRAHRHGGTVALLMIDVEKLREINNKLGSRIGDEVLRSVGKVIKENTRDVDVVARYGDDEYIVLLYGIDEIKAQSFIQRLRENVRTWNQARKLPTEVKLNMAFVTSDRDFEALPERIKGIIDGHKGVPL